MATFDIQHMGVGGDFSSLLPAYSKNVGYMHQPVQDTIPMMGVSAHTLIQPNQTMVGNGQQAWYNTPAAINNPRVNLVRAPQHIAVHKPVMYAQQPQTILQRPVQIVNSAGQQYQMAPSAANRAAVNAPVQYVQMQNGVQPIRQVAADNSVMVNVNGSLQKGILHNGQVYVLENSGQGLVNNGLMPQTVVLNGTQNMGPVPVPAPYNAAARPAATTGAFIPQVFVGTRPPGRVVPPAGVRPVVTPAGHGQSTGVMPSMSAAMNVMGNGHYMLNGLPVSSGVNVFKPMPAVTAAGAKTVFPNGMADISSMAMPGMSMPLPASAGTPPVPATGVMEQRVVFNPTARAGGVGVIGDARRSRDGSARGSDTPNSPASSISKSNSASPLAAASPVDEVAAPAAETPPPADGSRLQMLQMIGQTMAACQMTLETGLATAMAGQLTPLEQQVVAAAYQAEMQRRAAQPDVVADKGQVAKNGLLSDKADAQVLISEPKAQLADGVAGLAKVTGVTNGGIGEGLGAFNAFGFSLFGGSVPGAKERSVMSDDSKHTAPDQKTGELLPVAAATAKLPLAASELSNKMNGLLVLQVAE
eukprot:jgi/Chrzof1/12090/Cz06g21010.t1